jgi:RimJ/RimL family protein N-acetyltransferase
MTRRLVDLDLRGEHARLRPHCRADAGQAFRQLQGEQEILRWLVWDGPDTQQELEEHYGEWCSYREGLPDLRLAIEDLASGDLAGSMSLRFSGHPDQGDVGYWIALAQQRRGLGSEALALTAHLAFSHLGASSLYAWVFVGNHGSRRVLERTGFTLTRSAGGRVRKQGQRVDEWHFVLLASEWRRLRADFRPLRDSVSWGTEPSPQAPPDASEARGDSAAGSLGAG